MGKLTQKSILSALSNAHDGFMISDANGTFLYFNQAYQQLTKLFTITPGASIQDYMEIGPIRNPACLQAVRDRKTTSRMHMIEETGVAIISVSQPCFDSSGNITHVITNVRDVTEFFDLRNQIDDVHRVMTQLSESIEQPGQYGSIIAINEQMRTLLDMAEKVAAVDVTVLIQGESGTGKEVLAKFIHERSTRKEAPFLAINCGAIPETLLETELFGYADGTFTGQRRGGKEGLLCTANGGTLFLDEVGDMPQQLQVKLLRFLESRQYTPVGSHRCINSDVRILSATNRNLHQMIAEGTFREDLFYRLNVVNLSIPPLRDRRDDIIPLALFFLKGFNEKYHLDKHLSAPAIKQLRDHTWPGNVRELRNIIERMAVISEGSALALPPDFKHQGIEPFVDLGRAEEQLLPLSEYMGRKEKEYLRGAYHRCGTTRKVAEAMGIDHSTVIRKMKRYGISATS